MDGSEADIGLETAKIYSYPAEHSKVTELESQRKLEHAREVHIEPPPVKVRQDWRGPRTLTLQRHNDGGYGFTLRYFVVYPPRCVYQKSSSTKDSDFDSCWSEFDIPDEEEHRPEPLDTFFVKNIVKDGPADLAGLTEGDRIVSVNGYLIGGKKYKDVVDLIQASIGDLKLGVVPRDEDILQLAYQEYVDDRASQGYSDGWKDVASDFEMQKPSVNKWSTPVVVNTRKSSGGTGQSDGTRAVKVKRYDPCVGFQAGAPILSPETKLFHVSNPISDVGNAGRKVSSSSRTSRGGSSENLSDVNRERPSEVPGSVYGGKDSDSSLREGRQAINVESYRTAPNQRGGKVQAINSDSQVTAEELTQRSAGSRDVVCAADTQDGAVFSSHSYYPGKQKHLISSKIEREIAQVANPGLVRRLAGTFNSGNVPRKSSVTSVLRDDFKLQGTSVLREDFQTQEEMETVPSCAGPVPSLTVTAGDTTARADDFHRPIHPGEDIKFQLSMSVSESSANQCLVTMNSSHDPKRGAKRGNKLSSLTSQATLVESQYLSTAQPSSGGSTSSDEGSPVSPEGSTITTITQSGPVSKSVRRTVKLRNEDLERRLSNRVGFVVTSGDSMRTLTTTTRSGQTLTATTKISSYSDVSDDDSNVDCKDECRDTESASADEGLSVPEQSTWRGRRISYLMATSATSPSASFKGFNGVHMEVDDEDCDVVNALPELHRQMSEESVDEMEDLKNVPITREGMLNKKMVQASDGRKRATIRGWKPVHAVLRGHVLYCYKERGVTPGVYEDDRLPSINMKGSVVDIAHDYGKRKHVFRLATQGGCEFLFQAEDTQSMMSWVNALRDSNPDKEVSGGGYEDVIIRRMKTYENDAAGPIPGNKHQSKKTLSLRKTHFMLGRSGTKKRNPVSVHISLGKEKEIHASGITFGVPLEHCPPAKSAPNIPLVVEHCCQVVEEKGLECVGIYRVPGNAAAIQALQEELDNKEPENITWEEEKWHDLNNISSLLKSFLRKLPEPVIPKDMYDKFIHANRLEPPGERLKALRQQVRALPEYHYETLQFLIKHLKKVADFSETNKMEPKNLAIVFGPTVVRTSEENMVTMVKDMSDQCRIIETLLQQCEWIYSEDETMEAVAIEPVEGKVDIFGRNNGIVASKGLLESLGQVAESMQGEITGDPSVRLPTTTTSKEGKGVASAIMSLTSFTTSFSMKLRNKAMSPMFSKKQKQDPSLAASEDEFSESQDESTSPLTPLRRLNTEPHGLALDSLVASKQRSAKSDGEDEDEPYRIKAKIKQRGYVRALGPTAAPQVRKVPPKVPEEVRMRPIESSGGVNNTASVTLNLRKDVSPKDETKKEFNFDAYKANMLSEKTRMRLIKVSMEHHAALEQRQVEKERIDQEREKTLHDLRQDDDDFLDEQLVVSPGRDSDDNLSSTSDSTSSSRKESIDSLSSPPFQRKVVTHSRQISGSSISSEEKAPSYAINFREMRKDFRKPQPIKIEPLQPPQPVQIEQITPMQTADPVPVRPLEKAVRREIGEEEKRELEAFMGQFESSYEEDTHEFEAKLSSDDRSINIPDRNLFEAKTLDEKLKILLDPSYQERDGCLVKSHGSQSESLRLATRTRSEESQRPPQPGPWVMSPTLERRSNFSASIRGIERPYKTKVIGINVPRSHPVSPPGGQLYGSDMAARFDTFKQKKQELEKKVTSILQESSKPKDSSPRELGAAQYYLDDLRPLETARQEEHVPDYQLSLPLDPQSSPQYISDCRMTVPSDKHASDGLPSPTAQRVIVSASNVQQAKSTSVQVHEGSPIGSSNLQDRFDRNVQQVVELLSSSDQCAVSSQESSDAKLAALLLRLQRQKVEVVEPQPAPKPIPLSSSRNTRNNTRGESDHMARGQNSHVQQQSYLSPRDENRNLSGRPDLVRVQEWRTASTSPSTSSPKFPK